MKRQTSCAAIAAIALAVAATASSANDLYWQGTDGSVDSPNYFDATTSTAGVGVGSADALYIGAGSTLTQVSDLTAGRLIVGHNGTNTAGVTGAPTLAGVGTVQITGGNFSITAGSSTSVAGYTTSPNAGLVIGASASGSLSITNAAVTVNDSVVVGLSPTDATIQASLAVNTGGSLTLTAGGLALGGNGSSSVAGAGGSLTVAGGTVAINGSGADLIIGTWNKSTFIQTGGTTTVADEVFVGRRNADNTSFTLSGGTFSAKNFNVADTSGSGRVDGVTVSVTNSNLNLTGLLGLGEANAHDAAMTIGQGAMVSVGGAINVAGNGSTSGTPPVTTASSAVNTSLTINGNANVAAGSFSVGNGSAATSTLNITGDAVVSTKSHITIGNSVSSGTIATANLSTFNLSGNASVQIGAAGDSTAANLFLGRGNTTNTTLNMSGTSSLNVENLFLMGTGPNPTGVVVNQSGGTITAGYDVRLCDTGGTSTFNLSGTGVVNSVQGVYVGRQKGTATFNQTGGTMNLNGPIRVGDAQNAPTDKTLWANGTYNLSAGSVNVTVAAGSAGLTIAPQGAGTFRVIGGDAAVQINGDVRVNTTLADGTSPAYLGTLAYRLEAGESLTKINATGTATFSAGSVLALDLNGVASPASSYDLLTATDVVNGGLVLSAPAGWHVDLVDGATSKTLKIIQALNGDANQNGKIDADDYALIDRGTALHAQWWHNGDFNDNGVIDAQDYLLIDAALGQQNGGHLSPGFLAARELQFGSGYVSDLVAAVPEPGTLSVLAAGLLPLLGRRRRTR